MTMIALGLVVPLSSLVHAQQENPQAKPTAEPTVEDAVYADLALRNYLDNVSVSYDENNPALNFSLDAEKHWYPASTIKLYAAMYAYDQIDKGNIHLSDTVTAEAKNVVDTELETDKFPPIQEGNIVTIDTLIRQMLTQSDNTAFNILLDVLDRQKVTDYIHSLGLIHTSVGSKLNLDTSQEEYEYDVQGYGINTTTAQDYTNAFIMIRDHKVTYADQLYDDLKGQQIRNMIPLLLPKDTIVANKTGDLAPIYHDGGIISATNRKFVLSIFTNTNDPNVVAHLAQIIYTKNFDLVGSQLQSPVSVNPFSYPIDPLITSPIAMGSSPDNLFKYVLAAETQANLQVTPLTAADLGITAKDLSLAISKKQLPHVIIPPDSPWHILLPTVQLLAKTFVVGGQAARAKVDLGFIPQQLADAQYLQDHGKKKEAQVLLQQVQPQLQQLVTNKDLLASTNAQTQIQALSETRFSLLGQQLQGSDTNTKKQIIEQIATEAKATVNNINPHIPKAINATNPNQSVLTGTVVDSTPTTVTVKTSAGTITIPTDNLKIRSSQTITPPTTVPGTPSLSATPVPTPTGTQTQLQPGTSVALAGSIDNQGFGATFILTHVPTELTAPQPVAVVKVSDRTKTMVVEQNGIPLQVNVDPQTTIKGSSTDIPLGAIKPGDIVVVHGNPVVQPIITQQKSVPTPTNVAPSSSPATPVPGKQTSGTGNQTVTPGTQLTSAPGKSQANQATTATSKPQTTTGKTTLPLNQKPKIIQSTSIQVVEQKKDMSLPLPTSNTSKPSAPQSKSQPQAPQPKSPPPAAPRPQKKK